MSESDDSYTFKPIGVIRTPYREKRGIPIQGLLDVSSRGTVEIKKEFEPGLKDLQGFSHICLVYLFHKSAGYKLEVVPYLDTGTRGVFATRAPRRPNPIGVTVVELLSLDGNRIEFAGADMLDGTPLLDIKPFLWDLYKDIDYRGGWTGGRFGSGDALKSDERF